MFNTNIDTMIVNNFRENCNKYENFQVWDIESIDDFLNGNAVLPEIFKTDYKMTVDEFKSRREEVPHSDVAIVDSLLGQIGDKHFFTFTMNDKNHIELILMQDTKMMNFGMDISSIQDDHIYAIIMDKQKN